METVTVGHPLNRRISVQMQQPAPAKRMGLPGGVEAQRDDQQRPQGNPMLERLEINFPVKIDVYKRQAPGRR